MVQAPNKKITLANFLALPETKPASEFVNGQILQKSMPQGQHSTLQGELVTQINAVTKPKKLAWAFPELRCTFGGKSLVPDVAVFTWARIPTTETGNIANQFNKAPDWTVEILSPGQSSTRVTSNILHCIENGTLLGWLIDPAEEIILVYQPNQPPLSLETGQQKLVVPAFASKLTLTIESVFSWLQII
ncbi:MAG: Uma2 family endonuclease [Cyanobacteria bacterium J06643_4]